MPTASPLHPLFAARITGIDICRAGSAAEAAWLRDALDHRSVLVFPGQTISDEAQITFSETFGALETTRAGADGAGGKLIALTNISADEDVLPFCPGDSLGRRRQGIHPDFIYRQRGGAPAHGSRHGAMSVGGSLIAA